MASSSSCLLQRSRVACLSERLERRSQSTVEAPFCLLGKKALRTSSSSLQTNRRGQYLSSSFLGKQRHVSAEALCGSVQSRGQGRGRIQAMWLDSNAEVRSDVPLEECWEHWMDREKIPQWMPWIKTVKVLEDQPELSRWTLSYRAFEQDLSFSWVARNMQPVFHQKIHWRSTDGLPNRGAVRFYKNRDGTCQIKMTISYEVPGLLAPLAQGLTPIVEGIIQKDLERFVDYARAHRLKIPATK